MIRKAEENDLLKILDIYQNAKEFMRKIGNPSQWNDPYPEKELLQKDIRRQELFVLEEGKIHTVFLFSLKGGSCGQMKKATD